MLSATYTSTRRFLNFVAFGRSTILRCQFCSQSARTVFACLSLTSCATNWNHFRINANSSCQFYRFTYLVMSTGLASLCLLRPTNRLHLFPLVHHRRHSISTRRRSLAYLMVCWRMRVLTPIRFHSLASPTRFLFEEKLQFSSQSYIETSDDYSPPLLTVVFTNPANFRFSTAESTFDAATTIRPCGFNNFNSDAKNSIPLSVFVFKITKLKLEFG